MRQELFMDLRVGIISTLICILLSSNYICAQTVENTIKKDDYVFCDLYIGTQVSGIRKEDYVKSNFSPYLNIMVGKWINPLIAFGVGYQGPWFNFIVDDEKHKYFYIDAATLVNLNSFLTSRRGKFWNVNVIAGGGLLYNSFEHKINLCLTGAVVQEFTFKNDLHLNLKVGGIIGWAIYQHDQDILPNLSIGLSKKF